MSIHNIREKTRVFAPRSILPTACYSHDMNEWSYVCGACVRSPRCVHISFLLFLLVVRCVHWHRVASAWNNKQSNHFIENQNPIAFVICTFGRTLTGDFLRFVNFLKPSNDVIWRRDKYFHIYSNFRLALPIMATSIEQMIISICVRWCRIPFAVCIDSWRAT